MNLNPAEISELIKSRIEGLGEQTDIRNFSPAPDSYDAATVYFSMIAGVTQDEIRGFVRKIYGFVKPGGAFVFATVAVPAESVQIKWMGKPVTVSSLSSDEVATAVKDAGFSVEHHEASTFTPKGAEAGICGPEDVWPEPHVFVYAKKPAA